MCTNLLVCGLLHGLGWHCLLCSPQVIDISPLVYRDTLMRTVDASFVTGRLGGNLHHIDAHMLLDGSEVYILIDNTRATLLWCVLLGANCLFLGFSSHRRCRKHAYIAFATA